MSDIRLLVDHLNEDFPDVKFTYGYIGNCGFNFDERSYYIFTKVRRRDSPQYRYKFLLGGPNSTAQDRLNKTKTDAFYAWINKVVNQ